MCKITDLGLKPRFALGSAAPLMAAHKSAYLESLLLGHLGHCGVSVTCGPQEKPLRVKQEAALKSNRAGTERECDRDLFWCHALYSRK